MAKTYVAKYKAVEGPDGRLYRAEWRHQHTCSEVGIRGPFKDTVFKANGKPKHVDGYRTAFKIRNGKAMATDPRKSKKREGEMDLDWHHFAEALGYEVV